MRLLVGMRSAASRGCAPHPHLPSSKELPVVSKRQWIEYALRQGVEWLVLFIVNYCLAAFVLCMAVTITALIVIGIIGVRTGAVPESGWVILGWCLVFVLAGLVLVFMLSGVIFLLSNRLLVGTVQWVEEGADIDGTREWMSTVRLSCCPGLIITTPVAFPYKGTEGRTMIVWLPRGPVPASKRVTANHATLL